MLFYLRAATATALVSAHGVPVLNLERGGVSYVANGCFKRNRFSRHWMIPVQSDVRVRHILHKYGLGLTIRARDLELAAFDKAHVFGEL